MNALLQIIVWKRVYLGLVLWFGVGQKQVVSENGGIVL